MKVTRVVVDNLYTNELQTDLGVKASVRVIFDNVFEVHRVKVIRGKKGLFVAMPYIQSIIKEDGKKEFLDMAHALTVDFSKHIEKEVLDAYFAKCDEFAKLS